MRPGTQLNGEQKEPRRIAVEAMHWPEIRQSSASQKPDEQRALVVFAGRRYRHAVGFVNNEDFVVAVDDQRLLERRRFALNLFSIEDRDAVPVRRVLAYGGSVAQSKLALQNARA